jgi:oligoendopeptidase F
MTAVPPSDRELDAYREQADRFIAELDEEFYLHYAGLKESFDLAPIYERHANLTELEQVQSIGLAVNGGDRVRELWRFACEGYFGDLTREHAEKLAELESELQVDVDGEEIPYRMVRPALANEPDRDKRRELDERATAILDEHMNALHLDAAHVVQQGARDLGFANYLELYRKALPPSAIDELAEKCRAFLSSTERLYEEAADQLFRARVGVSLTEAERWDVPRLFRAPEWDPMFPADKMVPALEGTLSELGIDLKSQENVTLDLDERPNKSPRAFCAPIEVPDRVVLVIQPIGGPDDWRALFHEGGHTEHFAHTSRDLSMEEKRLGDSAVTEGWAMLLQHLTDEPEWLTRRLDFPRPTEYAVEGATGLLYFVRRYAAKILYELEFHAAEDVTTMRDRYAELLSDALKIDVTPANYLADIDSGFYVSAYLRSWAFEAQLRAYLKEKFGSKWFANREAGSLLRELWSEGQRMRAEEMLKEVTGSTLEMEAVAERVREVLR